MSTTARRVCSLCEAMCGLTMQINGEGKSKTPSNIRGDATDVFSQGACCPKSQALATLYHDPQRLRQPLKRGAAGFEAISWDQAFTEIAARVNALQQNFGRASIATYLGNPNVHNTGSLLTLPLFLKGIGSPNKFSATSVDQLPHQLVAFLMFGHQLLLPIADVDRTQYMLILGANPAVSNGSLLSAPGLASRLKAIQKRGGQVVVIDPRYTETASLATRHHPIRPGSDAFFLAGFVKRLFEKPTLRLGRLQAHLQGLDRLEAIFADYSLEHLESRTGLSIAILDQIVNEFLEAKGALCYGRMGLSTQKYGTLCQWLINLINILSGNFDSPGGVLFTKPAFDLIKIMAASGNRGSFGRRRSRVRDLPEFSGEFPAATLATEILSEGKGQIRGLFTVAGNPVLSLPNGKQLAAALPQLDLHVAIDFYMNETTRLADYILPPTTPLEHSHYDVVFNAFAVRNIARYSPPVLEKSLDEGLEDWEILLELWSRIGRQDSWFNKRALTTQLLRRVGIDSLIDIGLRLGPYRGLSLKKLRQHPEGIDLGPLQPSVPGRLFTKDKKIQLAPDHLLNAWNDFRKEAETAPAKPKPEEFLLIGRRNLRSNNSWLHNSPVPGQKRHPCYLLMHPNDALRHSIDDGGRVSVSTRIGAVELPVLLSDKMMPGVVSMPHGWGQQKAPMPDASDLSGVSMNDITDDQELDQSSGNAVLNGQVVRVRALLQASI